MIMLAELEQGQRNPQDVAHWLHQLAEHDSDLIPQVLPLARRCADNGALDLGAYLDSAIRNSSPPRVETILARADEYKRTSGFMEASRYVVANIQQQPSLQGLLYLIDLHSDQVGSRGRDNLLILRGVVEGLLQDKHQYRCQACGFSGRRLHWQCPTCHGWSTIRPIKTPVPVAAARPEHI